MANQNDEKIMELKAQIKEKKNNIKKGKKFTPVTNCSIELYGVRHNINVLSKDQLIALLIRLNSYRLSAIDLKMLDDFTISGFKVDDWLTDIRARLEVVAQREEENKLQELENKLYILLSTDKKVELEIGEIESLLK